MSAVARKLDLVSPPRIESPRDARQIVTDLGYPSDWIWAWDNYKKTIVELSHERRLLRHLEIGGGRDPLFLPDEARAHGASRVYWLTHESNATARLLYDRIADRPGFIQYRKVL